MENAEKKGSAGWGAGAGPEPRQMTGTISRTRDVLEFGDGEDGARAEGLFVIKPINARWDLGDPFAVGQEEMGRLPPPGCFCSSSAKVSRFLPT